MNFSGTEIMLTHHDVFLMYGTVPETKLLNELKNITKNRENGCPEWVSVCI